MKPPLSYPPRTMRGMAPGKAYAQKVAEDRRLSEISIPSREWDKSTLARWIEARHYSTSNASRSALYLVMVRVTLLPEGERKIGVARLFCSDSLEQAIAYQMRLKLAVPTLETFIDDTRAVKEALRHKG